MKYEAISWEGALIGPETIDKISDENAVKGQKAGDFGLKGKVRDEILSAWAESKIQWSLFKARRSREDNKDPYGTSRTRQSWVVPFLSLLGYELENSTAKTAAGKTFAISHHDANKLCPVHITGFTESLDKKREGQRASPHSLVQEYINLTDTLYALVTNGLTLRLLRDSSRLVKLTYLEFNLERIFEEDLFADFALLFRLLHISRWPESEESASDCLLEVYHLDSLDNGSRIREKLSEAVKNAIIAWADGFLRHQDNEELRKSVLDKTLDGKGFYDALLTVVYRILFLLVIEERGLTHPDGADAGKKKIYLDYYSVSSLRNRARSMWSEEGRYYDLWETLRDTFSLFESEEEAEVLDLKPLAGDLFSVHSFSLLRSLSLDNTSFAAGLNLLDSYEDEKRRTMVRVNYAALNVEEFGSIYEGLLEFDGEIVKESNAFSFHFVSGGDRGKSGSHYTPEELVQPLIAHALDPLLEQCLTEDDAEQKILSLKICDDACGSGHILLNAARRLALELSRIRTKADNPDPVSYRKALREVIERCIYGVDFNPQAVRLCKVALWLESHNPGESLGFLDHHIKCGDSLVGLTSASELLEPIPDAAFAPRDGDDKAYAALLRSRQKSESKIELTMQIMRDWRSSIGDSLKNVIETLTLISKMPDSTPEQAAAKKAQYEAVTMGETWRSLKNLADIRLAPFFLLKNKDTPIATELLYRNFLNGRETMSSHPAALKAEEVSSSRRFFHWFLEFAEVMQDGGFDCFLGNPPFLGNRKLKSSFGANYLDFLTYEYAPAGAIDLVGYFVRRNYKLLKDNRSLGTLATNTIAQGGTREGGLEVIEKEGGTIVMAVRSRPWPGVAAVEVSLAAIHKGPWQGKCVLDGKQVDFISTYFDDQMTNGNPKPLIANADKAFVGTYVLGQGFVLEPAEAEALIARNLKNSDVLFPYLNGEDLNSRSDQSPSRWVINFFDWPLDRDSAPEGYTGPVAADYPDCLEIVERLVKPERTRVDENGKFALRSPLPQRWWHYADKRPALYRTIAPLERVMVVAQVSRTLAFSFTDKNKVLDAKLIAFAFEDFFYLAIMQSAFHFLWSWKYCTTMKADLSYTPTAIFQTFPFPPGFEPNGEGSKANPIISERLEPLGERLDADRREIMMKLDIGLTKLYNLYHNPELSPSSVMKEAKCLEDNALLGVEKITALRELHKEIDEAVRDAYGWSDLPLQHGFHELEFLPENDRVRYTVSTAARKDILRSLLELNHKRHKEEVKAGLVDENGKVLKKKAKVKKVQEGNNGQGEMF